MIEVTIQRGKDTSLP